MSVLIDSGLWIAFYNNRDQYHEKAVALMKEINSGSYGALLSSDYILDEAVNYCLTKYSPEKSIFVGEAILNTTDMIKITPDILTRSWELFKADKQNKPDERFLSYTDCTSIMAAKMLGISQIVTFDSRFRKYVKVLD
ncbi:type II toxin-antitoxin system VapC family toxin [Candidatus Micrarchaeota archaeon]|nr:type II toxin-antitoxin system VapC family toxin [Candidatus Micrarchaeota archaeon]